MPIIPKFSISQNDDFVLVTITLPYIRVSSAELITDGHDFSFFCQPYLLKLTFPCEFHEDDERCKAVYDPTINNGTLVAHLPKKVVGQYFPDLDLTTSLLQLRKSKEVNSTTPDGIEVLNSMDYGNENDVDELVIDNKLKLNTSSEVWYGFNNKYTKVLQHLRDELVDMLEIRDPEMVQPCDRRALRLRSENKRFDVERYLGDYFDGENDPMYSEAMSFTPIWVRQWDAYQQLDKVDAQLAKQRLADQRPSDAVPTPVELNSDGDSAQSTTTETSLTNKERAFDSTGGFSASERETLSSGLKHREYLVPRGGVEESALLLTLADILFAYCYDVRTTAGEERNVESAANIARMSCALSWLDPLSHPQLDSVSSVIKCSLRRSVILPYLRIWKLSRKVLTDVTKILFLGRRAILKCLLNIHSAFEHTDTHYLLNKLFIDDFCVWIQGAQNISDESLQAFAKQYNAAKTAIETAPHQGKEFMGLHLPELEKWAVQQQQEEGEEEEEEESDGESESESESESDDSSSDDEEEEEEVEELQSAGVTASAKRDAAAAASEEQGDFLRSVPKRLRRYDSIHTAGGDLAYLDATLGSAGVGLEGHSEESTASAARAVSQLLHQPPLSVPPQSERDQLLAGLRDMVGSGGGSGQSRAPTSSATQQEEEASTRGPVRVPEGQSRSGGRLIEILSSDDITVGDRDAISNNTASSKSSGSLFLREVSTKKVARASDATERSAAPPAVGFGLITEVTEDLTKLTIDSAQA